MSRKSNFINKFDLVAVWVPWSPLILFQAGYSLDLLPASWINRHLLPLCSPVATSLISPEESGFPLVVIEKLIWCPVKVFSVPKRVWIFLHVFVLFSLNLLFWYLQVLNHVNTGAVCFYILKKALSVCYLGRFCNIISELCIPVDLSHDDILLNIVLFVRNFSRAIGGIFILDLAAPVISLEADLNWLQLRHFNKQ